MPRLKDDPESFILAERTGAGVRVALVEYGDVSFEWTETPERAQTRVNALRRTYNALPFVDRRDDDGGMPIIRRERPTEKRGPFQI